MIVIVIFGIIVAVSSNSLGNTIYQVNVHYPGTWECTIISDGNTQSVSGTGSKTINVNSSNVISLDIMKQDASGDSLLVTITQNGQMEDNTSTIAPYGGLEWL